MNMNTIKRVLISVTDKKGIVDFAKELAAFNVEILSTGGTAAQIRNSGLAVRDVSDYTGFPEMMDGRLKTLHPKIHGGLLALRDNENHMKALAEHGIGLIDMVVINLYEFEKTVAQEGCSLDHAIENIDIGGPTMLRAASKNYRFVTVVTDPDDYGKIIAEMKETGGKISEATNFALAVKTFQTTARYDGAISNYLGKLAPYGGETRDFPDTFTVQFAKAQDLRYGENPHQKAVFYRETDPNIPAISNARQIQGKELSYNNIMDSDAAWQAVSDFKLPAAVIMKHANPCGAAAFSGELVDVYLKALETDPVSAFGGIVAFNRPIDKKTADELAKIFLEVIIAPGIDAEAAAILETKKNVRVLLIPQTGGSSTGFDFRRVVGGLLVQDRDKTDFDIRKARVVTKRQPTEEEYAALDFAWRIVKHVKSNAIVFATNHQLVGVGAGQMSRVDSVKIATMKAQLPTKGTALGSDAFFPFRDGVDMAAEAGVTAIIQPGGSVRDDEAIQAADEHGIAMIFTGERHFKH
ncbi:MAG TPA: bifunctional phosphoribosylaminoimidazolecarboxamide formyltransferase/IMP cyclohydrolase [Syntrophales bacterium]|nr:bifunctional phosphoribosylaminoimidazolecarboxamide formyltransferase/IMP cyclohydrolase [Syntrophales bacterium]